MVFIIERTNSITYVFTLKLSAIQLLCVRSEKYFTVNKRSGESTKPQNSSVSMFVFLLELVKDPHSIVMANKVSHPSESLFHGRTERKSWT